MKIKKLKINNYGKLKDVELDFKNNINIIYGKNEAGKSTLLNFILSSFYGISRNKKGKEISDYEKYMPWNGEEFSGKLEYELDDEKSYEIYRDFKKKNPKLYNNNKEEITKEFNIDKTNGNEFFYEQTRMDEELFLSTIMVEQDEVKLEEKSQNLLIQKITNLLGTGENNVSFKRVIERLNKRQLNEIGTERSRGKPINLIMEDIERLEIEKQELEKYQNIKYEIEENKNKLNEEIALLDAENNIVQELKLIDENEKLENEKINIKQTLKRENEEKIKDLNKKIEEAEKESKEENNEKLIIKKEKNRLVKNIIIIGLFLLLINILQFMFIKNTIISSIIIVLSIVCSIAYYIISNNKLSKKEKETKEKLQKIKFETSSLIGERTLLENNINGLNDEIEGLKSKLNLMMNIEKEKIKNKYLGKLNDERLESIFNINNIYTERENIQNNLNDKKLELHSLDLDYKNIEPKLENISKIEEELISNQDKKINLERLNTSINLAKEMLIDSYNEMKKSISPKFTENLSNTIKEITNGKYNNVMYQDEKGLIIELENGDYLPANVLSIGTIDQLYLSLRIAMIEELSKENMPIILDESFAYYDNERLKNILEYMNKKLGNHQVIIFTCTKREKEILENLEINYNYIEL